MSGQTSGPNNPRISTDLLEVAPEWLKDFSVLGSNLRSSKDSRHLGAVIAPPTGPFFGLALALASLGQNDSMNVADSSEGSRVATILNKKFLDADISQSAHAGARISLDHVPIARGVEPPMAPLPSDMPGRPAREIPEEVEELLIGSSGDGSIGMESKARALRWSLFTSALNPVVVLTSRNNQLAERLSDVLSLPLGWSSFHKSVQYLAGTSPDDWYRTPLIICTPKSLKNRSWVSGLSPSLVVTIGMTPWLTKSRWVWPGVPHVLLLDPRTEDVLEYRAWAPGHEVETFGVDSLGNRVLPGIPVRVFAENYVTIGVDEIEDFD